MNEIGVYAAYEFVPFLFIEMIFKSFEQCLNKNSHSLTSLPPSTFTSPDLRRILLTENVNCLCGDCNLLFDENIEVNHSLIVIIVVMPSCASLMIPGNPLL